MRLSPSQLTIREIIGQLMMPKLPDTIELLDASVWQRVVDDQSRFAFGGYIVFRGDRERTPPLLAELQDLSEMPLLFGADLERGAGQQFSGATEFPHVMALGAARDPDLAFQQGAITALEARRVGIHWVFAPVLDLASRPDNPIINVRGFGDSPRIVGTLGAAFVAGVQRYNGLACAKHFPGHGQTSTDSHEELPELIISRHKLETEDLLPFRQVIDTGLKSVMVGHLAVPALDETGLPATMSKRIVTDILREQLGFKGLIVTDALDMGAIVKRFEPGYAAVRALQAGCDVLLMPPDPEAVVEAVLRAIEEGGLTKQRLLESAERLDQARLDLGLWGGYEEPEAPAAAVWMDYQPAVEAISDGAVTLLDAREGLLPLGKAGSACMVMLDDDNDSILQQNFRQCVAQLEGVPQNLPFFVLEGDADESTVAELCAEATHHDVVIVAVFMAVRAWKNRVAPPPLLTALPGRLKAGGCQVIVVSFTSPFLGPLMAPWDAFICAYSGDSATQKSVLRSLWGLQPMSGRLPVAHSAAWAQV